MKARALYDCSPDQPDELTFKKDDLIINVTETSEPNWYRGELNGHSGLIPGNYIEIIKEQIPQLFPSFKKEWTQIFNANLKQSESKLSAQQVKEIYMKSGLPKLELAQVWQLSDLDRDSKMDLVEFTLGLFIIDSKLKNGIPIPAVLPKDWNDWAQREKQKLSANSQASPIMTGKVWNPVQPAVNSTTTMPSQRQPSQTPLQPQSSNFSLFSNPQKQTVEQPRSTMQNISDAQQYLSTPQGQKTAQFALDHKEQIIQAAKSETGQQALKAAWKNKDMLSKFL